jgi:hypothetical protein
MDDLISRQPEKRTDKRTETHACDSISRQAVIDTLNVGAELLKRVLDDTDIVGVERAKYEWGLGLIESYISDMKDLPSAQPESATGIDNALTLLDAIHSSGRMDYYSDYCALHDAISSISAQPQIIHCADCRHWKHSDVRKNYCEVFDWVNTADDFCSFAEARTDETD